MSQPTSTVKITKRKGTTPRRTGIADVEDSDTSSEEHGGGIEEQHSPPGVPAPPLAPPPPPPLKTKPGASGRLANWQPGVRQPDARMKEIFGLKVPGPGSRPEGPEAMEAAKVVISDCVKGAADAENKVAIETLFQSLTFADTLPSLSAQDRVMLLKQLLNGLAEHDALAKVLDLHPDFVTTVIGYLTSGELPPLAPADCFQLSYLFITKTFGHKGLVELCGTQPDLVCTLLRNAARLMGKLNLPTDFIRQLLVLNGVKASDRLTLACTFLTANWTITKITEIGPDLLNWMRTTITRNEWNSAKDPLGPLCLNMLWVCGEHDSIIQMLNDGVDCTRSTSAWGVAGREGVWTGYVQPLTHVLGKYIKSISLLGTDQEGTIKDVTRVLGAKKVVAAIGTLPRKPDLVLDFGVVKQCSMIKNFQAFTAADQVGTIWGFEDVRLPYVQAARATKYGQRPLRMLDMWEAVQVIFEPTEYAALIADPATVARRCALTGADTVRQRVAAGAAQYDDIDLERFIPNFVDVCTSFLTYFATEIPFVKTLELPSATGKNASKLMPSLVCKVGLWWSLKHNKPVFYCLDGLDMNEVVGYKANKTVKINEYLTTLNENPATTLVPFQDVITFAELREVLKNWSRLRAVVKLVMQGRLMTVDEADTWANQWLPQLNTIDAMTEPRMWQDSKGSVREQLLKLFDNGAFWDRVDPRTQRNCALEFKSLSLAATGDADLLVKTLEDCEGLVNAGLVPEQFADVYKEALAADGSRRPILASMLRYMIGFISCVPLRAPLLAAVNRHLAAPLALMPPPAQ